MSANTTARERGEAFLDQQAEIRLRELQSPTAARQSDRVYLEQTVIGQLIKAPDQLDRASILEPADFASPDYRAWLTALRTLAKHRGTLTGDDVPDAIEAVSELMKRPVAEMATQARLMMEQVWSTANVEDSALRVKRQAAQARLDSAMKSGDVKKTRAALAAIDALDAIKAGQSKAKSDRVQLLRGDEITPEPISWLWPGWLARGKTHILAGPPGTGKTNIAMAMTAAITRGGIMPDGSRVEAKAVVIWSGEDGIEDTLVPRLILNGADMSKVHFVRSIMTAKGGDRSFDPGYDIPLLKQTILDSGDEVGMFLVDPVASVVVGDGHKNNQVRRAMQPLVDLATETKCAALGITHLTKASADRDPIDRIVGSVAFGGVARVVMMAVKMPSDAGGGGLLVRAKSNIGPDDGGYRYYLEKDRLPTDNRIEATRVLYGDKLEGSPRDLLAMAESIPDAEERGAIREAKDYIMESLANGPMPQTEIEEEAKKRRISKRTLDRAKASLKVESTRGFDKRWRWSLPQKNVGNVGNLGNVGILGNVGNVNGPDGQGCQGCQNNEMVGNLSYKVESTTYSQECQECQECQGFHENDRNGHGHAGDETADALEAEGRRLLEAAKTAPSEVQILPSGEIIGGSVPAPGTRLDLRNRGNRLFQQARALRLAEAEKLERPPEEPDISPDIASASQAETQSPTDTWANKTPDITRDNPPPAAAPPSPLDIDITRYLRNVSGIASEEEVHRQTSHGKAGRTPAMTRIALHKLVAAGVVDKVNGQYRLARGARS